MDISRIIKEFERLTYKDYVWKSPKHEPTDSYFYLPRQISNCMMISDAFNLHVDPVRPEMTDTQQILISHICDSNVIKSKQIIVDEKLSQVCSTDKSES